MTRGYVLIIRNKKIVAVAYSNSDSYYSHLGVQVLDAFEKGTDGVLGLIEKLNGENERFKDDIEGFCFEWYRKTKENADSFFVDYVYEYNADKKTLTVYYYGTKILSFGMDSLDLARFVFESDKIDYAFAYNQNTLEYDFDSAQKEIRKAFAAKMSAEDLSAIVEEKYGQIGFYLSSGKIRDVWDNSYIKEARTVDRKTSFKFVISQERYGKREFNIHVCTPFIRLNAIRKSFRSETAAIKALRQFLIDNQDRLVETYKVYPIWETENAKLRALVDNYKNTAINTQETLDILVNNVRAVVDGFKKRLSNEVSDQIFTFGGSFSKDAINRQFSDNGYYAWRRFAEELQRENEAKAQ